MVLQMNNNLIGDTLAVLLEVAENKGTFKQSQSQNQKPTPEWLDMFKLTLSGDESRRS
jgi:hypothetical protein